MPELADLQTLAVLVGEAVVGPPRGIVEKLDDVVGGTDCPDLEVCRAPRAGEEALEDGAPRGQLGRGGEDVLVVLVGRVRRRAIR